MPVSTQADVIVVPGKVDILVAYNVNYDVLYKLGESEDQIAVRKVPIYMPVSGDRYGGRAGKPIEQQFMGMHVEFNLQMSRWDNTHVRRLEKLGGLLPNPGRVPLTSIGALTQKANGVRILLFSVRDPYQSLNIPNAMQAGPQESTRGTKYSACGMSFEGHRVDTGSWQGTQYAGLIDFVYNKDLTGLDAAYLAQYGHASTLPATVAAAETALDA